MADELVLLIRGGEAVDESFERSPLALDEPRHREGIRRTASCSSRAASRQAFYESLRGYAEHYAALLQADRGIVLAAVQQSGVGVWLVGLGLAQPRQNLTGVAGKVLVVALGPQHLSSAGQVGRASHPFDQHVGKGDAAPA